MNGDDSQLLYSSKVHLEELDVSGNKLDSAEAATVLARTLEAAPRLNRVNLTGCSLSATAFAIVLDAVASRLADKPDVQLQLSHNLV